MCYFRTQGPRARICNSCARNSATHARDQIPWPLLASHTLLRDARCAKQARKPIPNWVAVRNEFGTRGATRALQAHAFLARVLNSHARDVVGAKQARGIC